MKMKTLKSILAAMALVAAFSACNRDITYEFEPYVTFSNSTSATINEDGEASFPVQLMNANGSTVNVAITINSAASTAQEGVDFELTSPANGVLTFSGQENEVQNITFKAIPHEGEYTGNLSFTFSVSSSTAGAYTGANNSASVTIQDLDHPLSHLFGTYTGTWSTYRGDVQMAVIVTADPDDLNNVWVLDLDPYTNSYTYALTGANQYDGTLSEDQMTITIPDMSPNGLSSSSYGAMFLRGTDDTNVYYDDIRLRYGDENHDTIYLANPEMYTLVSAGWFTYTFGGQENSTLTRQ